MNETGIDCTSGRDRYVIKDAFYILPRLDLDGLVSMRDGGDVRFFTVRLPDALANALREAAREVDLHVRTINNGAGI